MILNSIFSTLEFNTYQIEKDLKILSELNLNEEMTSRISATLSKPVERKGKDLQGRVLMVVDEIKGLGKIIVKNYSRGGLFQKILKNNHLAVGEFRPLIEFKILKFLLDHGINVPKPLAIAQKGKCIYKGWLVSEYIDNIGTLVDISLKDPVKARHYTERLVIELKKIIELNILHTDLHPGNVIISAINDLPYIIDFDKAIVYKGTKAQLKELYLRRWRRAVIKHNLPEILSEIMCLGLLSR